MSTIVIQCVRGHTRLNLIAQIALVFIPEEAFKLDPCKIASEWGRQAPYLMQCNVITCSSTCFGNR